MLFLYNLFIFVYKASAKLLAFFNKKAKLWVEGRKNLLQNIKIAMKDNTSAIAWFHCASLGEFEQARPLIESFKKKFPAFKIVLTFFSPSGYEIRKNYGYADFVFYLPSDTKRNANDFIELVKPKIVFFTKYEFWYHFLKTLSANNIQTLSFSAIFRKEQIFFKSYGKFYLKFLNLFNIIFVQDKNSYDLLKDHGVNHVNICGDTRFDRVLEQTKLTKKFPIVENFIGDEKVIILGSSWPDDFDVLKVTLLNRSYKIIIAPHEISEQDNVSIELFFKDNTQRYSLANSTSLESKKVLIIDNIGMLSSLYQYANLAYIGGGFGKGIHNILEAAAFGIPVVFGPNFNRFKEAQDLIKLGCAFSISKSDNFNSIIDILSDQDKLDNIDKASKKYIIDNSGATTEILNYCQKIINL